MDQGFLAWLYQRSLAELLSGQVSDQSDTVGYVIILTHRESSVLCYSPGVPLAELQTPPMQVWPMETL